MSVVLKTKPIQQITESAVKTVLTPSELTQVATRVVAFNKYYTLPLVCRKSAALTMFAACFNINEARIFTKNVFMCSVRFSH
jgi:hypothetical protein